MQSLKFDAVIAATGFTGNFDFLDQEIKPPSLHGKFPDIDGIFGGRGVDGLYFTGALTHGPDYRSFSSSGFIHGFRYNSMILARHLAERLGAVEAPARIAPDGLCEHLLRELEEDAGIYLQPGYVGRCYLQSGNGIWLDLGHRTRRWFEAEATADETPACDPGIRRHPLVSDVLRIPRYPRPSRAERSSASGHPRVPPTARRKSISRELLNQFVGIAANHRRLETFVATCSPPS